MDEHAANFRTRKAIWLNAQLLVDDPALLDCSFGAVVGNRSATCQMGPISSKGRLTGIEVPAPKDTPFAARTTRRRWRSLMDEGAAPRGHLNWSCN